MEYKCLRDCFVNSVLWREGNIYNLPDSMHKSPKNFRPLSEPLQSKSEAGGFVCEVCGKELKTKLALSGHKRTHKEKVR
jgi:hypothetical protein